MTARVQPMLRVVVRRTELDAAAELSCGLMFGERFTCASCLSAPGNQTWSVKRKGKGVAYALCQGCSDTFNGDTEAVWRKVESNVDANLDRVCRW